jgi:hypothetical protein
MEVKACAVWINIKNNKIVLSIAASIFFAVANSVSAAYGQTQEKNALHNNSNLHQQTSDRLMPNCNIIHQI